MEIHTTARHFELTPALREHVQERLDRIRRHLGAAPKVRVVLAVEKYRHQAELTLHSDGQHLIARGISEDMYASVDLAVEKLLRQLKRQKDRRSSRRARPLLVGGQARIDVFAAPGPEPAGEAVPVPVETEHQEVELLTLGEAITRLDARSLSVLVFARKEGGGLHVLYRRADRRLGLVKAEGEGPGEGAGGEGEEP